MTRTIESRQGIAPCRVAPHKGAPMRSLPIPTARTGRVAPLAFALRATGSDAVGKLGRTFAKESDS
ncbi:MAG TPA: hypothetical protein VKE42_06655 [Candidatus Cybelea sp.]|nr:hypothetical protein [Candidatus Cybelea sp.]